VNASIFSGGGNVECLGVAGMEWRSELGKMDFLFLEEVAFSLSGGTSPGVESVSDELGGLDVFALFILRSARRT